MKRSVADAYQGEDHRHFDRDGDDAQQGANRTMSDVTDPASK